MSCGFSIKNGCFFLQLPTAEQWYHASEAVLSLITGDFDNADDAGAEGHRRALGALKDYAGADLAFSEQRCAKALPQALIVYKEGLPAHYVEEYHERKARHCRDATGPGPRPKARGPKAILASPSSP